MYSVSFLSFDSFKSSKQKTDLAASKKPMTPLFSVTTNVKTNSRSKMPMYFPALLSRALKRY